MTEMPAGEHPLPQIADRQTWQAKIDELRVKEKAHTRAGDALAAERRRLPMVEVDPQTPLIGADGPVPLIDIFDGRSQLIAYFQMWHTGRPAAEQCEGCTFSTTHINELSYLHSRDVSYATFCQGPYGHKAISTVCSGSRPAVHQELAVSLSPACVCSSCPAHPAGVSAPPACGFYPSSSLTDAQWAILDAIFYLVRGGIAWRQLPAGFPPPTTVYDRFRAWAKAGVWQVIHDALRDLVRLYEGRDPLPTAAVIDSQSVRGADTVPRAGQGYQAGKRVNGRKRHIAVDTGGLLLAVIVTMAGLQDRDAAHRLLARLRERLTTIALVWADAGYSGWLLVWARNVVHLTVQIVKRTEPGFVVLPRRWVVERTFAWISKHRRCVRDYETKPDHHEAMIYIAMIMNMSRRLARTGDW